MRCSVCGHDRKYHKIAWWALYSKTPAGRWTQETEAFNGSKCTAIQLFQSALINSTFDGKPLTLRKAPISEK